MSLALENFIQLSASNKIVIIGDMFELGEESLAEHKAIVSLLESKGSGIECYLIGKDFYTNRIEGSSFHFFESFEGFAAAFEGRHLENKSLLIKGSRGMALERVLELL
jgi:UDP-N-acetylmuramoyl-tripeptide--D-alanyl-D-alanine ligase